MNEPRARYTKRSQKEKNRYCILTHIYEIYKNSKDEPVCRAAIEMQTREEILDPMGEGVGGTHLKSNTDTYTLPYVK